MIYLYVLIGAVITIFSYIILGTFVATIIQYFFDGIDSEKDFEMTAYLWPLFLILGMGYLPFLGIGKFSKYLFNKAYTWAKEYPYYREFKALYDRKGHIRTDRYDKFISKYGTRKFELAKERYK